MNYKGPTTLMMMMTNCLFSQEIRSAPVLNHFMLPKMPKYDERGDLTKYLNGFKTHMGLRGATPAMKCRAFHLTFNGVAIVWFTRLQAGSNRSWLDFKKAFFKHFATSNEGEGPIELPRHEATPR